MPSRKSFRDLRGYRKHSGLSQYDVAFLRNLDRALITRHENLTGNLMLKDALAYEVIFMTPSRAIFNSTFQTIKRATVQKAKKLHAKLTRERPAFKVNEKIAYLNSMAEYWSHGGFNQAAAAFQH